MSIIPDDAGLRDAVEACLASRPELEADTGKIASNIKDNHPIWKVDSVRVKKIVEIIVSERVPPIVKPEKLFEFDFKKAQPASIERGKYDWHKQEIEGIHHAQGGLGSTGVFLVKLKNHGVVVLKQKVPDVAREIFAQCLLQSLGINAPAIRSLPFREFKAFTEKLAPSPVTVKGTCLEIHGSRMQETGGVLMEFVPGLELGSPLLRLSQNEFRKVLFEVGRMVAVDVLLNNADRTPFLRRGDGNPGNIMINKPGKGGEKNLKVIAIDQTVSPISDTNILNNYLSAIDSRSEKDYRKLLSFLCESLVGSTNAKSYVQDKDALASLTGTVRFISFHNIVVS
uniref:Actin-fragmin kinase catalytic domain-containing protein n=2 Tax=Aplanochytrium stocchinoi TaxID=215587 RepID=A0A6S8E5N0_9STRA|mmetsp:Transcript_11333/g.12845  ORF Transcript_11333/g.12845 Transcript_11333/m.12845 type:complete len:340 (-) Transcript_11333:562-1581(-)